MNLSHGKRGWWTYTFFRPRDRRNSGVTTKLSAANRIKGRIVGVRTGVTTANVRIEIAPGVIITASITNEAAAELDLHDGMEAYAVIKASDVMVGVP